MSFWAETSKRDVAYALCNDRRTLLWFANQRAIEYHPALVRADAARSHDPPHPRPRPARGRRRSPRPCAAARLVRQALDDVGLAGAVKTSGAKGVHVFVPIDDDVTIEDAAAATRAIAVRAAALDPDLATTEFVKDDRGGKVFVDSTRVGGGTVVAAYSPRVRPGVPVSFPVGWDDLDDDRPARLHGAHRARPPRRPRPVGRADARRRRRSRSELVDEGGEIPVGRVAAMHEGKRRKRAAERDGLTPVRSPPGAPVDRRRDPAGAVVVHRSRAAAAAAGVGRLRRR